MKFLHTSDWHLGRGFHGVGLLDEQRSVLAQMSETVRAEGIEAVLVPGDVYDRALPGVDVVALMDQALVQLRESGAELIITSGNHDSAARLGFGRELLTFGGVHLLTSLSQLTQPVTYPLGEDTDLAVYGIPYLEPRAVAGALEVEEITHTAVTAAAIAQIRADLAQRQQQGKVRSVLLAHTFASTGVSSDSERSLGIGGLGVIPTDLFEGFDYVALGHLHGRQELTSAIRYSGSPLPYSFSEEHHEKGGWIVEITADGLQDVTAVNWQPGRRLARLKGTLEELLTEPQHSSAEDKYCQITLTDTHRPARAMERLRARFPHTLVLGYEPQGAPTKKESYRRRIAKAVDDVQLTADFLLHVRERPVDELERAELTTAVETARAAGHSA